MATKLTAKEVKELDALSQAYELAKAALREKLDEIASNWESEWSEKSERWQEGEAGQAAQEKIDMLRAGMDELAAGWRA